MSDSPADVAEPRVADTASVPDSREHAGALVARKLSALFPGLDPTSQVQLRDLVLAALAEVVRREVRRVHHEVADIVGESAGNPRSPVPNAAMDFQDGMPELISRLSPLLTAEDFLGLLGGPPGWDGSVASEARTGASKSTSREVAAIGTECAITALLENAVASIRESALDAMAAPATAVGILRRPAIRRARLSDRAARALTGFVAAHVLDRVAGFPGVSFPLREKLRQRLEAGLVPDSILMLRTPDIREAMDQARRLQNENRLTEEALLAAVQKGEARMATAILAVASGLPVPAVDWATTLRSAKGLVSLVWKAGFSMRVAVPLQTLLARLSPANVLRPAPGNGFPLSVEEMRWQIEFLENMGR